MPLPCVPLSRSIVTLTEEPVGTLRGTPRLSGAGSALCTADTGAGTDTGLASAPRGRARKSQGSIVLQDKGGQQPWDLLGGAALQQQPAERWLPAPAVCVSVFTVSPPCPVPPFPGKQACTSLVIASLPQPDCLVETKGNFSSSHGVFGPHVP